MTARWHIMDFGLTKANGHHYWGARAVSSELRRRNIDVMIYGHQLLSSDLADMGIVPLFRSHTYHTLSTDPAWVEVETFVMHNWVTQEDLTRLDPAQFADATVLFPTVTYNQLLGIARWIARFHPASPPKTVLVLMFPPEWKPWPGGAPGKGPSYYRSIWSNLPESSRKHILLCTQTEEIARAYETILGIKPTPLPYYLDPAPPAAFATGRDQGDGLLVSFLGGARTERGVERIPEIVSACLAAHPKVRFFVQVNDAYQHLPEAWHLDQNDRVSTHSGRMDPDAYLAAMCGTGLLLLPLDPVHYRTKSSGVYWQAVMAGTPVAVPAGTWMAERVRLHGHGVVFATSSPEAIAAAVVEAHDCIAELRVNARRYADVLCAENGTAAFVDAIDRLSARAHAA